MELEKLQAKSSLKAHCPEHGEITLIEDYKEIKTGYREVVRKIMHVGKCPIEGCSKWCEIFYDYIVWA